MNDSSVDLIEDLLEPSHLKSYLSHEFFSGLNSVLGYSNLLEEGLSKRELTELAAFACVTAGNARRLHNIMNLMQHIILIKASGGKTYIKTNRYSSYDAAGD